MGLQYTGFTTGQRGIEADETGINIKSFSVRYFPAFKDKIVNYQGQVRGWCIPDKLSREAKIAGELITNTTTGLAAAVWNVAITLANDTGLFVAVTAGSNAGGFYLDEATDDQSADGWRSLSLSLSSDPLVS